METDVTFEPWASRRTTILGMYTTSERIPITTVSVCVCVCGHMIMLVVHVCVCVCASTDRLLMFYGTVSPLSEFLVK